VSEEYISVNYAILTWMLISLVIISISLKLIGLIQGEDRNIPRRIANIVLSYINTASSYGEEIPFSLPKLSYDYKIVLNGSALTVVVSNRRVLEVELEGYTTDKVYVIIPDREYVVLVKGDVIRLIEV